MKKPAKKKCKGCSKPSCACNKKKGGKIPTPRAKGQKGNAKPQSMRKRSAY